MINITGRLEIRRAYGAPWCAAWPQYSAHESPYPIVLKGRAVVDGLETETASALAGGNIVLVPHGSTRVLHGGSGHAPGAT